MVKKHLPVTKLVARNANKMHVLFSRRSSLGYPAFIFAAGDWALPGFTPARPSLAAPRCGRYKPPHPATRHMW
jgi:hypothetical protein